MDIKISDNWLRDYLITKATPEKIGEYLSLCGPSVERIEKVKGDSVYDIEVTTNRIDTASVYGIAREASAILPRFKVEAKLKRLNPPDTYKFVDNVDYLSATVDKNLCPRFTAVLIKNVTIDHSPDWMASRVEKGGIRVINNVVDISNYIMLGLGQPVHTFDYDKILGAKMHLRASRKGEKITTLDGLSFELPGGDIVIEDGEGRLIDLAGIMGGNLSMVDDDTKNVLLFVQTYSSSAIRKTSMSLAQRTQASAIFEKGTDAELVTPAILTGIDLFREVCHGVPEKEILNIYPAPYKAAKIDVDYAEITQRLGIAIAKPEITKILNSLEFETSWKGNSLYAIPPSYRANDVFSSEDVIEEIARIYGYHNFESRLMTGEIPDEPQNKEFDFEENIKNILSGWGGTEVYTLSLVPKEFVAETALKLKNPLGTDTEYLRTSLMPSLINASKDNAGTSDNFHLFEMANVYIPKHGELPEEKLMLAGIFSGYEFRLAKGIVEAFLNKLNIKPEFEAKDTKGFSANKVAAIVSSGKEIGLIGVTDDGLVYYEFGVGDLMKSMKPDSFKEISKYPSQIEDLTFTLPEKIKIGSVLDEAGKHNHVEEVELSDTFKNAYTFRVMYHSNEKTLTDADVEKIRNEIISSVKSKFGGQLKS